MPRPPTGLPPRQPPGTRRLLRSVSVKPFTEHIRRGQVTPEPPCNYRVVSMFVQLSDRRPQTEDRMRRTDRASRQARLAALFEGGAGTDLVAAPQEDDLRGVAGPLGAQDIDEVVEILDAHPSHSYDDIPFSKTRLLRRASRTDPGQPDALLVPRAQLPDRPKINPPSPAPPARPGRPAPGPPPPPPAGGAEVGDRPKVGPVSPTPSSPWRLFHPHIRDRVGAIGQVLDDPIHEAADLGEPVCIDLVRRV